MKKRWLSHIPGFTSGTRTTSNQTDGQTVVELRNVTKTYVMPTREFVALRDISLTIKAGEFVSIIGKSGSGKSTLINMITGIDHPTSGEVIVSGTPIHTLSENAMAIWRGRAMGVVFQFFQLLPTLTLLENVMLPMEFCRLYTPAERENRALQLLEMVDMAEHAFKLPAKVSGGQQQRVAIARALANNPALIVADEPTGSLDSNTAENIFQLFERLVEQGKTIVMVTHDQDLASRASRILVLAKGAVEEQYTPPGINVLDEQQMHEVVSNLLTLTFIPGSTIIRQGDPADMFFIIVEGQVEVVVQQENNQSIVVARMTRGQYFGETGLLLNGTRAATVRAAGDSQVVVLGLDRENFRNLVTDTDLNHVVIARLMRLSMRQSPLSSLEQVMDA